MALSIGLDFVDGTQTSIHPFCKLDFQTDSYNKWDKSSTFWEISHSSDVLTLITCEQLIMMICLKQNLKADNNTLLYSFVVLHVPSVCQFSLFIFLPRWFECCD